MDAHECSQDFFIFAHFHVFTVESTRTTHAVCPLCTNFLRQGKLDIHRDQIPLAPQVTNFFLSEWIWLQLQVSAATESFPLILRTLHVAYRDSLHGLYVRPPLCTSDQHYEWWICLARALYWTHWPLWQSGRYRCSKHPSAFMADEQPHVFPVLDGSHCLYNVPPLAFLL